MRSITISYNSPSPTCRHCSSAYKFVLGTYYTILYVGAMSVPEEPNCHLAVCVERACMSYRSLEVLRQLNMDVPTESMYIYLYRSTSCTNRARASTLTGGPRSTAVFSTRRYGLLGPSGCGKTTLLRCILGRLNLNSGRVTVLGKPPGSRGHHVPGRDVGYMPQVLYTCMYLKHASAKRLL